MYSGVKWYRTISQIEKYGKSSSDVKKKKDFLIQSFGIEKLKKYLGFGVSSRINQVAINLTNENMERVVKKWAKG